MKRIALILAFSLIASIAISAQDKPKTDTKMPDKTMDKTMDKPMDKSASMAMPTVDQVLDKYIKAIGGKEAMEKITSRSAKGTIEIESMNMSGTLETYAKAPNKTASQIELTGFGKINSAYDGSKAYSADPMSGVRELTGGELEATKRDADFYGPLNLKKTYAKLELKGKEKVGASDAYVILATPATGEPEKYYFDTETGLLVRQDSERDSPQGKMAVETYFSDYKEVDGLKVAHSLRQVTPAFTLAIKLNEIKHNVPVDDAKFVKPAGQ